MPTLTATIHITPIPNMATSTSFQISGTCTLNETTWTDDLVYEDDHGANVPISSPAVQLSTSSWSFAHDPLPPGTHTVSVKDPLTGTVAVSNSFTVGVAQAITANQPTGVVAGTPFNFTGILTNFTTIPTLTYSLNGGVQTPLSGVTVSGWTQQLTITSAGNYTLVVTNGAITSNTVSFTVAPVTVNHVITPNPPTPVSSPNYIFYDTFTSLNDVTDTGGAGITGLKTITTAGQSFVDQSGNTWSIVTSTSNGNQVQENGALAGFTANVAEVDLVNGTIWHKNNSNQWYSWTAPSTWTAGNNPLAGGTTGSWMNHYAFGGSEYTLSANGELEYFTSNTRTPGFSPFTLQNNGAGPGLVITCDTTPQASFNAGHTPSNPLNLAYNSGVIVSCTETSGEPTPGLFAFTYGLIEIQATLPGGSGAWAGFAMYRLGTPSAPGGSGELDIIENGGGNVTQVWGSIHSSTIGQSKAATVTDYTTNRHIYAVNWESDFITWYVDGNQYAQVATPPDFVGNQFYFALDFAMQGNPGLGFDGVPNASTPAPNRMNIDFVRVSQGATSGSSISAGQLVNFTGALSGYTTAPSLTYTINNGAPVAMTGVTTTGWSMQFNAPSVAGAYVLNVSDGTTQGTINFQVGTAAKVITPIAPTGVVAGRAFTFTGVMAGYTTIPALTYSLNGGTAVQMTGVSTTGWSMSITVPTAGSYNITVQDGGGTSGAANFTATAANTSLRDWTKNPGQNNSFWVQPFQSSANWITSGSLITALRGGTPSINLKGNYSAPFYVGKVGDPDVTVTDGTHSIVVKIPLGAIVETPSAQFDNTLGGLDSTQPYLMWSISGATINKSGAVEASGSVITGTYGFAVQDASGLLMVDAVTGAPGDNNSFGLIQDYDLSQLAANPNYIMQHMLTYQLDPSFQCSGAGPVWPLKVIDTSHTNSGPIPQGCTVGIPASVTRPNGQTRGFYALWDCMQQFGGFFYNVGSVGGINISIYDSQNAYASLVNDMVTSWPSVAAQLCILNPGDAPGYSSGVSGAQFSLATTKGAISGSTNAFPAPPPIDLSPTGGKDVLPSTFGAWYPSGYNVAANNASTAAFTISPNQPSNVVVNTAFTFTGSLSGYATAPTLTYTVDSGSATSLSGVTSTGWSAQITISTSGTHTITVNDAVNSVSGATTFNVSSTTPSATPVTWNPSDFAGGISLSNGNYTATASGSTTPGAVHQGVRATTAINAAKIVLWEVRADTINQDWSIGVANSTFGLTAGGGLGSEANGIGAYPSTGTGSQPAQTVYYNNAQLTAGNGVSDVSGDVITCVTNGSGFWFSDAAMRSTSGVQWNNSTTANPATGAGGFSISGIGATYYPIWQTLEGGAAATLNDGTSALSAFASSFISANPSVVTLSGQVTAGSAKAITPATPGGVVVNTPFTFTGTLTGYSSAPNLTYAINGGTPVALSGVTASGWSTTLTISNTGTDTITVTDGTVTGSTVSFTVAASGGGGGGNRVTAPLTGTVQTGSWNLGLQTSSISAAPFNGGTMQYNVLPPAQYNTNLQYPVLFIAHPDFDGMNGSSYKAASAFVVATAYVNGTQSIDSLFNNVAFRTAFPCILVAPQCFQPGSDQVDNFGGYGDSQNSAGNEQGINLIMQALVAGNVSGISSGTVDPGRRYAVGYSLGAIGTLAWLVDNNQYNGPGLKLWTAGIGMSDQLNRSGVSNITLFSRMSTVPYLAISTTSDNVPTSWDQPAWTSYTGNSNFPGKTNYDSGGMAAIRAGSSQFYYINDGGNNPTDPFMLINALGGDGTTMYNWLFSQIFSTAQITITGVSFAPASSVVAGSPVNTVAGQLTVGSANGALTGVTYALSSTTNFKVTTTGQIQFNSASVTAGSYTLNVTIGASNASNSPQTFGITIVVSAASATGQFKVDAVNGKIIAPDGSNWVGRGTDLRSSVIQNYVTNAACQPLTDMLPGVNVVRLSAYSYFSPSTYAQQINWLTALKIVVIIEDHMDSNGGTAGGAQGVVFTGTQLTNELNWYAALATAFKSNTYVWFGTNNEPSQSPSLSALYTWQQQTYNAIRNTGSNCIIEMEQPNPFQQGARGSGIPNTIFSSMTNIVFGPHYYSWIWGGQGTTVPQSTIYSSAVGSTNSQWGGIVQQIANIRYFPSADGSKVPCGCFEFGPSTDGSNLDASGTNNVNAVFQAVTNGDLFMFTSWIIEDSGPDNMGTNTGLTSWGNLVKAQVALNTTTAPPASSLPAAINRTEDLLGTFGANTELYGSNLTPYVDSTGMVRDVTFMGLRLIRWDLSPGTSPNSQQVAVLTALANAGIRFVALPPYIFQGNQTVVISDLIAQIKMINALGPGNTVAFIEGLNEPSNFAYTYNGVTGGGGPSGNGNWTAIANFQKDYQASLKADSVLKNIPTTLPTNTYAENPNTGVQFTTIPSGAGTTFSAGTAFGDMISLHVYPEFLSPAMGNVVEAGVGDASQIYMSGDHVSTSTNHYTGYASVAAALQQPHIVTEFNWRIPPNGNGSSYPLSDSWRAKNVLTGLLSMWVQGYQAICVHEVYDEGDGYGIYTSGAVATLLATSLHNFTTIMNDPATNRKTFNPTLITVGISGLPSSGKTHLYQTAAGVYRLVAWNEVNNGNGISSSIVISPSTITVTWPSIGTINNYDPTINTSVQSTTHATSFTMSLTDHPLIMEWIPG